MGVAYEFTIVRSDSLSGSPVLSYHFNGPAPHSSPHNRCLSFALITRWMLVVIWGWFNPHGYHGTFSLPRLGITIIHYCNRNTGLDENSKLRLLLGFLIHP